MVNTNNTPCTKCENITRVPKMPGRKGIKESIQVGADGRGLGWQQALQIHQTQKPEHLQIHQNTKKDILGVLGSSFNFFSMSAGRDTKHIA